MVAKQTKMDSKLSQSGQFKPMRILVACEESQAVTKAFRAKGHEAYSCDIQECSGGHPEWHLKADVRDLLPIYFDLVIFHPVCRVIANSGVRWLHTEAGRWDDLKAACEFFNLRHKFNSPRVLTENSIPHKYATALIGEYDQIFQPWHFGHEEMKGICLWLKGLPPLKPTNIVGPPVGDQRKEWAKVHRMSPGPERSKLRSKTYQGFADALADQYGNLLSIPTQPQLF